MTRSKDWFFVAVALVMSGSLARAHHSFSAVFDQKREVTVTGIVTQFKFVNPHATMNMDVTDESGKVVKWVVEFAGQLNLAEGGWTAKSIQPGERVTVTGNPAHSILARMSFLRLIRPDGSELLPVGAERQRAIEEARRQRALERSQQK